MSVTVKEFNITEKKFKDSELNGDVFGQTPNTHVMHLSVVRQLANARVGTASSLTRSEVRGGGRKPWKQKGTGRARAGSSRSPLWRGGGVIFGPKPRSYEKGMPKKVRKLALRSALSAKLSDIIVIDGDFVDSHKTKSFVKLVSSLGLNKDAKILAVSADNNNLKLAAKNMPNAKVVYPQNLGVYDLLNAEHVLIDKASISILEGRASK